MVSKYCLRKKIDEVQLSKVANVEKSTADNFFQLIDSKMLIEQNAQISQRINQSFQAARLDS